MRLEHTKAFRHALRGRSDADVQAAAAAMAEAAEVFGHPHVHQGTGIRRLSNNLFECRAGVHLRLLFTHQQGTLIFVYAGNHDEVRKYLRNK